MNTNNTGKRDNMRELQEKATKLVAEKGHFLGRWMMHPTFGISRSYTYCTKCIMRVDVDIDNSSISGTPIDDTGRILSIGRGAWGITSQTLCAGRSRKGA
jgi:hypothetical protein